MNAPHRSAEIVKDLANQLYVPDTVAIHANAFTQLHGMAGHRIRYLGRGQEFQTGENTFGVYARGARNDDSWLTHEVHIDFVSPPDARHIRQNIGHISLSLGLDGELSLSTHGFDKKELEQRIPMQTLVTPLGEWMTTAAIKDYHANAEARVAQVLPPIEPVSATPEQLEPLRTFVDDAANMTAYFRFAYENNITVGVLTAPAQ